MASLVETLKQQDAQKKAEATRRHREALARAQSLDHYRELLSRSDAPGDGDGDTLRDLMDTLGIDLSDVEADLAALAQYRQTVARVLDAEGRARVERACATELAAVADEQRALFHRMVDALPAADVLPALTRFAAENYRALQPSGLTTVDPSGWQRRTSVASCDYQNRLRSSQEAAVKAEQLRRDYPRVLGGTESL